VAGIANLEQRRRERFGVDCACEVSERGVTVEESGEQDPQSAQEHVREGRRLAREAFRALKEAEPGAEVDVRRTIEEAISELEQALEAL
jgi:hypothetical protein